MTKDARIEALRNRLERAAQADGRDPEDRAQLGQGSAGLSELQRASAVEMAIQQAIRQGEFDDLPGAGKPLDGLEGVRDPDWWIRRKIETEKLSGLGPPALTLRVEHAELDDRLDRLTREESVREALEDFNARVVEARRQLLGGPPVVTPTRDVEAEVAAWRARREQRLETERLLREERESRERQERAAAGGRRRRWWRRH